MGEIERNIQFLLGWDVQNGFHGKERQSQSMTNEPRARAISLKLGSRQPGNQVVVSDLCYYAQDYLMDTNPKPLVHLERLDRAAYQAHLPGSWRGDMLKNKTKYYEPQKFYRFSPKLLADLPSDTEARLREYVSEIENRLLNTFYLGPLREQPKRYYVATGERPNDLGLNGQKIGTVLYAAEGEGKLIKETSEWLMRLGIAESVSLSRLAKGNIFHLNIHGNNQRINVNIADFGFGASQILPVIVESLYSPTGSTILVEQPEIHLNAHHQLELPNFFAEIVSKHGKQAIVETHSEYFLKRLSTLVATDQISHERVIVYYCYADQEGSHIQPINLDAKGRYAWWPKDFLAEGYEGTAEHMEAMQAGESVS